MTFGPYTYLAALLLAVAGWVGGTAVAAGAWDPVRDAALTPVTEKRADADGSSLAVYTDIVQPERDIRCRGRDTRGVAVDIPAASIDIAVDDDGAEWHLVGLLPHARDGLKVRCGALDRRVDNATYSYAVVDGFTARGRSGQLVALGGLVAGLALGGYTFYARRNLRKARAS